jgi:hypothetical protein
MDPDLYYDFMDVPNGPHEAVGQPGRTYYRLQNYGRIGHLAKAVAILEKEM